MQQLFITFARKKGKDKARQNKKKQDPSNHQPKDCVAGLLSQKIVSFVLIWPFPHIDVYMGEAVQVNLTEFFLFYVLIYFACGAY